jgi:hypothetical protein
MKKIQDKEEKGLAMGWNAGFAISLVDKRINLSLSISINRNVTTKFQIYIKKKELNMGLCHACVSIYSVP